MDQPDTLFTTVVLLSKFGFFLSNSLQKMFMTLARALRMRIKRD